METLKNVIKQMIIHFDLPKFFAIDNWKDMGRVAETVPNILCLTSLMSHCPIDVQMRDYFKNLGDVSMLGNHKMIICT